MAIISRVTTVQKLTMKFHYASNALPCLHVFGNDRDPPIPHYMGGSSRIPFVYSFLT